MIKTWEDNNVLLREDWNSRHRHFELYYAIRFSYDTRKERDSAFEYFNDDETKNMNMALPRKKGDTDIVIIKYISVGENQNKDRTINEWVDYVAEKTGAYNTEIVESSYDEYHDAIEQNDTDNLHEANEKTYTLVIVFKNEFDRWEAFKKLKTKGLNPTLLEQALSDNAIYSNRIKKAARSKKSLVVDYPSKEKASLVILAFLDRFEDRIPEMHDIWIEENF